MTFNIRFSHPLSLQISTFTGTYICIWVCPDFIKLYLNDLQKKPQSIFWSYFILSDISLTAASAGKAIHTSGSPCAGSLGQCSLSSGNWITLVPEQPIPAARMSMISREHGLSFLKKHSLLSFSCPALVGFVLALCGTLGHALSREEAGLGRGRGGLSFQHCRLRLPGSSASLPRWPWYF